MKGTNPAAGFSLGMGYGYDVAELIAEISALKARIERAEALCVRAERERDEYQGQIHELHERLRNQTSAASLAASTAIVAITRVEYYDVLVKAAADWAGETDKAKRNELARDMYELALAEHARRKEAS